MHSLDTLIGGGLVNTICEYSVLVVVLLCYKSLLEDKAILKYGYTFLWLFLTLFSIFYSPQAGDSFTSLNTYRLYNSGTESDALHFETVYFIIMNLVSNSYVLWRFVIWGSAAAIFVYMLKRTGAESQQSLFIWAYLGLQAIYYQRVSLAMALMFLGVFIYLINDGHQNKNKIIPALLLLVVSLFFHRSMPIYIVVTALVLFLPTKKWSMIALLIGIPLILPLIAKETGILLEDMSSDVQEWGEIYLDGTKVNTNGVKGTIFQVFKWTPYVIMMVYCVVDLLRQPETYSKLERYFLLFATVLYMLSFMLDGIVAGSVGTKMKMQSTMSMTMFLSLYYTSHKGTKQCNIYAKAALFTYLVIFIYEHFL